MPPFSQVLSAISEHVDRWPLYLPVVAAPLASAVEQAFLSENAREQTYRDLDGR